MEVWKDIKDYEGSYQVSNQGNVKSLKSDGLIMKPTLSSTGYLNVQLYKNNKAKVVHVHSLVAKEFIINPDGKPEINHIDGDKTNNRVENLEWVTKSENAQHAIKNNLRKPCPTIGKTGVMNHNSKTIIQYSLDGVFLKEWIGVSETARTLNCNPSQIFACLAGKRKSGAGFIWKYKTSTSYPLKIEPKILTYQGTRTWKQQNPREMHKIVQLTIDGKIVKVWDNYRQIIDETGYNNGNIYKVITGRNRSAYGFVWKYAD